MIESDVEYENSRAVTKDLTKAIYEQNNDHEINQLETKTIKLNIIVLRETRNNAKLNEIRSQLSEKQQRLNYTSYIPVQLALKKKVDQ